MKTTRLLLAILMVASANVSFAKGNNKEDKALTPVAAMEIVTECTASELKNSGEDCNYKKLDDAEKLLQEVANVNKHAYMRTAAAKILEARAAVIELTAVMQGAGRDQDGVGEKN
ncbi:MAG: hypothetical protein JNM39_17835 [Bdellovibrionaceae bacterium]|nr:hypothetical protein [Pseudobdellovibrionaceae bacterium]